MCFFVCFQSTDVISFSPIILIDIVLVHALDQYRPPWLSHKQLYTLSVSMCHQSITISTIIEWFYDAEGHVLDNSVRDRSVSAYDACNGAMKRGDW